VLEEAELSGLLIQRTTSEVPQTMYFIWIGATSVSGVTMSDALALRNVCRRWAICDFLNNAR
jgi:hypothetical protein